jgi:uncharacterized membrane protein YhhN
MYNLTNVTSGSNVFEVFKGVNQLGINGLFSTLILFVLFIVIYFMASKESGFKRAFIGSSFVVTIIAIGFFFLQLINIQGLIFPLILLFVAILVWIFGSD